jgi:hypothetical protein
LQTWEIWLSWGTATLETMLHELAHIDGSYSRKEVVEEKYISEQKEP